MNLFTKTLLAGAMLVGSSASYATSFYVDLTGTGLGIAGGDGDFVTGTKDQLGFNYESNTVINLGGNGAVDVGDTIVTTGGIDTTSIATIESSFEFNHFSGLIPSGDSEGYTTDMDIAGTSNWALSFAFNLIGEIDQVAPGNIVQEVSYSSGLIEIFLITYDGAGGIAAAQNIFDLTVTGSDNSNPSNFLVNGIVSFSGNEPAAYQDLFQSTKGSCLGSSSFYDLANCTPPVEVSFVLDQNLDDVVASVTGPNTAVIGGNHNGSLEFNVPEPSTLLLLGSSLFAFGATRRKKA